MPADPKCPQCHGSGWVYKDRDGVTSTSKCECLKEGRAAEVESTAGIPPLYRQSSFENFKLPTDNPIANRALAKALLDVRSYARDFPATEKRGLLLVGDPGIGKTHLAVAALRILIGKGFEGMFFDYKTLLDRIRSSYDPTSGQPDKEVYRAVLDTEVLLLDDLGAHRISDWVEDTVASIITHRCNQQKALIATTNLPDADFGSNMTASSPVGVQMKRGLSEAIGSRAHSRLFEMCRVVRMPQVEDYRKRIR